MAIKGFDTNYFVQALFDYAEENYPAWAAGKDVADLETALQSWYPDAEDLDAAAEAAYADLGAAFGIAPNEYFNAAEYRLFYAIRQTELKLVTEAQALAAYDAELAGETFNGDAYAHYLAKGAALGVNPSNEFDSTAYLEALIEGLGIEDMDAADLLALAIAEGFTPLDFYVDYPEFQEEYPAIPVDDIVEPEPEVNTFYLTNGTDRAAANLFIADQVYTPGGDDRVNSLQDEDVLTGVGEYPTLTAVLGNANDNGARIITPQLNNIEIANIAFTGSGNAVVSVDMQDADTLAAVNITRVSTASNFAAVENINTVLDTMSIAKTNANQAGAVELSFNNGTLRGSNTGSLNLDNVQVGAVHIGRNAAMTNPALPLVANVAGEGYENLTVDSTGTAINSIGALNLPMDTGTDGKVIITGDADLVLAAANPVVTAGTPNAEAVVYNGGIIGNSGRLSAIDASQLEASLSLAITGNLLSANKAGSAQTQNVTITGSANDDTFYLTDVLGAADVLTGGGGTDRAVIYTNGNVGSMSSIEVIDVQIDGASAALVPSPADDVITLNFGPLPGATTAQIPDAAIINVRNIGNDANVSADTNAEDQRVNLYNLSASQDDAINMYHSTTGNNGMFDTTLNATLLTDSAADSMIIGVNEALNTDARFNFTLNNVTATGTAQIIETISFKDNDAKSNSIALTNAPNYRGIINVGTTDGIGTAGTFINFDTASGIPGEVGGYGLDADGTAVDLTPAELLVLDTAVSTTAGLIANASYAQFDDGIAADVRLVSQAFNATYETSDVIARFGDVTRANGVSSQYVAGGSGNDTFIFDAQGVKNSGYTSGDTVAGGTGLDTLIIDGNTAALKADGTAGVGGNITIQKSEWDNTTGIDVLRIAGNQGVANGGGIVANNATAGGYYIEIDNEFVRQTDAGNGLKIVSNDGDLSTNLESDLILNLRGLSQASNVTFVGANGNGTVGIASNRLLLDDVTANSANVFNGGDTNVVQLYTAAQFGTTAAADAAWLAALAGGTDGNNNVLTVYNSADVSLSDLTGVSNFGRIEATNDTAAAQRLTLTLNNTVMDKLIDSSHTASAAQAERLTVVAVNNANVAAGVQNLSINAADVTNAFGLDVLASVGSTNNIVGSAGNDRVVLLGNYATGAYAVNEYGVAIDSLATNLVPAIASTDVVSLGAGNDTLVTYGALNLVGATLVGIENLVVNSDVTLTESQLASFQTITFGAGAHTLNVVESVGGTNAVNGANIINNGALTINGAATTINNPGTIGGTGTVNTPGINVAPVANDDAFTVNSLDAKVFTFAQLIANDSDPDGALANLTITGVSDATNGTVLLDNAAKTITFDPTANGAAGFTYTLSDGTATDTAAVTITVNAPVGNVQNIPANSIDTFTGIAAADTFVFDAAAALAATGTVTQATVASFDTALDVLQFNLPNATGATTLALLAGQQGVTVQYNDLDNYTLINFGLDADGDIVTIQLNGVPEANWAAINVAVV